MNSVIDGIILDLIDSGIGSDNVMSVVSLASRNRSVSLLDNDIMFIRVDGRFEMLFSCENRSQGEVVRRASVNLVRYGASEIQSLLELKLPDGYLSPGYFGEAGPNDLPVEIPFLMRKETSEVRSSNEWTLDGFNIKSGFIPVECLDESMGIWVEA